MWSEVLNFGLNIVENIGSFANWLFTPIAYEGLFASILQNYWGISFSFRPVDFISSGLLTTIFIMLLIKGANILS